MLLKSRTNNKGTWLDPYGTSEVKVVDVFKLIILSKLKKSFKLWLKPKSIQTTLTVYL